MDMREGWTVKVGDYETLEAEKLLRWKNMTPQARLDAMIELNRIWRGGSGPPIEKVWKIVTVPPVVKSE